MRIQSNPEIMDSEAVEGFCIMFEALRRKVRRACDERAQERGGPNAAMVPLAEMNRMVMEKLEPMEESYQYLMERALVHNKTLDLRDEQVSDRITGMMRGAAALRNYFGDRSGFSAAARIGMGHMIDDFLNVARVFTGQKEPEARRRMA